MISATPHSNEREPEWKQQQKKAAGYLKSGWLNFFPVITFVLYVWEQLFNFGYSLSSDNLMIFSQQNFKKKKNVKKTQQSNFQNRSITYVLSHKWGTQLKLK